MLIKPVGAKEWLCAWLVLSAWLWRAALAQESEGIAYRLAPQEELTAARGSAERVLTQIDSIVLSGSPISTLYDAAGQALKMRYRPAALAARLNDVRAPLGEVQDRSFSGFHGPYHTMPNLVAGEYLIIVFATHFKDKPGTYTEQVTLEADRAGAALWRAVEYYVAPRASAGEIR